MLYINQNIKGNPVGNRVGNSVGKKSRSRRIFTNIYRYLQAKSCL